MRFIETVVVR